MTLRMENGEESAYKAALAGALRILSLRDHSVAELARKLVRRGFAEEVVQAVVSECLRLNYLDDRRASEQAVERLKRKGCGARRIRMELARKGLTGADTEERLRNAFGPGEELEVALATARRKWKTLQPAADPGKRIQRLQRYLHSRGFSESVIYAVTADLGALSA
jgi:regulatory protein